MKLKAVSFGEILWDIFPNYKVIGGAPLNLILRMKSRILITSDIYRRLSNKARQSDLTVDELAEAYLKKQLKLR